MFLVPMIGNHYLQGESCIDSTGSTHHHFILLGRIISDNVGHFLMHLSDIADILLISAGNENEVIEKHVTIFGY